MAVGNGWVREHASRTKQWKMLRDCARKYHGAAWNDRTRNLVAVVGSANPKGARWTLEVPAQEAGLLPTSSEVAASLLYRPLGILDDMEEAVRRCFFYGSTTNSC